MARLSLAEVTRGTEGVLLRGSPEATVESFSIDTRTLKAGDLFFALVGPNHDAHRFVADAIAKGAGGVVIARGRTGDFPGAAAVIRVAESNRALQDLGAWVRHRLSPKVIGITGSTGKTTTKEMTAAVMEEAMPTLKSTGNLNNTFGLPLCLLDLNEGHRAAVLELGMSYAGEMTRLAEIADPDVGVLTNVYPVHLEHFPSLAAIADAKGELFRAMREDAVAVYNAEDPEVTRVAAPFPGRRISFGFAPPADVRAADLTPTGKGIRFRLELPGESREVEIPFPGRHHVANALAAAAASHAAGASADAIRRGLERTRPLPMRGALIKMKGDVRVLDETYNSNPKAMERTLEMLAGMPAKRKVVAAGDMRELGAALEREAHGALGTQIARAGAALFVAVGPLCRLAAETARAAGVPEVRHFEDSASAAGFLPAALSSGDLVLVKGSRSMAMERIVEAIRSFQGGEED